jgi:hypothetical protein
MFFFIKEKIMKNLGMWIYYTFDGVKWRVSRVYYNVRYFFRQQIQKSKRGFGDGDLWDFYTTISSFILPRLKRYKKINACYPCSMTCKEWNEILDKMIIAFELCLDEEIKEVEEEEKDQEKIREGLELFAEWFQHLWI